MNASTIQITESGIISGLISFDSPIRQVEYTVHTPDSLGYKAWQNELQKTAVEQQTDQESLNKVAKFRVLRRKPIFRSRNHEPYCPVPFPGYVFKCIWGVSCI